MLQRLRQAVIRDENVFAVLMEAVWRRWARSRTRCSRSEASTAAACSAGPCLAVAQAALRKVRLIRMPPTNAWCPSRRGITP